MARPLRIEYSGALYHVTSRGDRQENIFLDDSDRTAFLDLLGKVQTRSNWLVHAYCLMDNHYHLLVETPDGNLSHGMRQLNGVYTQNMNKRHEKVGHVFQGRYKAILVQKEAYLLELSRYIVLNPVRAHMVSTAVDWSWSSYRDTAGYRNAPKWLTTDWILATFDHDRSSAQEQYRYFVQAGMDQDSPWEYLRNQVFLGNEQYVEDVRKKIDSNKDLTEIPRSQRRPEYKSLEYYADKAAGRDEAIVLSYASGGYSMKTIGKYFGLHYSRVSRIVAKAEKAKSKT